MGGRIRTCHQQRHDEITIDTSSIRPTPMRLRRPTTKHGGHTLGTKTSTSTPCHGDNMVVSRRRRLKHPWTQPRKSRREMGRRERRECGCEGSLSNFTTRRNARARHEFLKNHPYAYPNAKSRTKHEHLTNDAIADAHYYRGRYDTHRNGSSSK